jgi:hypothetical protein
VSGRFGKEGKEKEDQKVVEYWVAEGVSGGGGGEVENEEDSFAKEQGRHRT